MKLRTVSSFAEVDPSAWDALAGDDNPFVEHAFLRLLETSGSVGPGTGWETRAILLEDGPRLIASCPAYRKTDSYGEYIFDWSWAEAAQRAGLRYYPKILAGVPFTPATGPRLLVHHQDQARRVELRARLIEGLIALTQKERASGTHLLFTLEEEAEQLGNSGFLHRTTTQYHWRNDGYQSFDDFLGALRSEPRKQIKKERRRVFEAGVEIARDNGDRLSETEWLELFRIYRSTTDRKWGRPYLSESFFQQARGTIGPRALIVRARREGRLIAASICFEKGQHLYGRYWGGLEQIDGLHFELCYYQLIEHAILSGKVLVEAGAQGEHKLKRGFLPVAIHSAHRFESSGLMEAVARAVSRENQALLAILPEAVLEGPFRADALPRFQPSAGIPLAVPPPRANGGR